MIGKFIAVAMLAILIAGCGKSATEKAKELRIEAESQAKYAKETAQRKVGYALADATKYNMRDPSSYQSELITVNQDATTVCLKYSAENAFGARIPSITVLSKDGLSNEVSAWRKHCTGSGMDAILIR